jgi:hypothetical protein
MWERFEIGFWHPFGPYAGLAPAQILEWKASETARYGWTFWSFAYARPEAWLEQLASVSGSVFVFCSDSRAARDPDPLSGMLLASHFQNVDDADWQAMPEQDIMKVTNPFKRKGRALAFKVARVFPITPQVPPFDVEWYSKGDRAWRSDVLPPRGEFLIRKGGRVRPRRVAAVLELEKPYLAVLKCESRPTRHGADGALSR